jgi:protein gp37
MNIHDTEAPLEPVLGHSSPSRTVVNINALLFSPKVSVQIVRSCPDTVHNTPRHSIGKLLEHIQQQTQQNKITYNCVKWKPYEPKTSRV